MARYRKRGTIDWYEKEPEDKPDTNWFWWALGIGLVLLILSGGSDGGEPGGTAGGFTPAVYESTQD